MRTHHVRSTDGVVLEVHDRGTSPSSSSSGLERDEPITLLLAHANGFHSRTWDAAVEELMRVASSSEGIGGRTGGVRVITFSFRAHGSSTAPTGGGKDALRWGKFAEDLLALVEQTPGLVRGELVGVGHSLGAHAMLSARKRPDPGPSRPCIASSPYSCAIQGSYRRLCPCRSNARRRRGGGRSLPARTLARRTDRNLH